LYKRSKLRHYGGNFGYGTILGSTGTGTAVRKVAGLLTQTLDEEYQADDSLTQLAVVKLNIQAEYADGMERSE